MKEIIKKEYVGECPICKRKQVDDNSRYVDVECYDCREKRETEEKRILKEEFESKVIGSEIIYFDSYNDYMRIKCRDGTVFKIEVWEGSIEIWFDIEKQKWNGSEWIKS